MKTIWSSQQKMSLKAQARKRKWNNLCMADPENVREIKQYSKLLQRLSIIGLSHTKHDFASKKYEIIH